MHSAIAEEGLLEREIELATIDRLLHATVDGHGGVLVVEGAAGVGKSALLRELGTRARAAPAKVVSASGGELERDFPFGMVRQLLEAEILTASAERRETLLSGSSALAGAVLGAAPTATAPSADATFATLHGIYWLVAALADEEPLILILDDVHWADPPSLRFTDFLARRIAELPVLLALGLRPNEPGAESELLRSLMDADAAEVIRPHPLSRGGVRDLVATRLGEEPAAEATAAAHETTGGNPLLLRELMRDLLAEGSGVTAAAIREAVPSSVTRSVERRLRRLDPTAREAAVVLAVLGDGRAAEGLLPDVMEADETAIDHALDALRAGGFLADEPPRYVHPLVRQAVEETVPLSERHRLHRSVVAALRGRPGAEEQLVVHLLASPPSGEPWAVELLRAAGARALTEGAPEAAVRRLRRALEELPHADPSRSALLLELGGVEARAGDPAADGHLDEASREGDDLVAAQALEMRIGLGQVVEEDAIRDLLGRAEPLVERLAGAGESDLSGRLAAQLMTALTMDARLGADRRRALAVIREDPPARLLSMLTWEAAAGDATRDETLALARRVLEPRPLARLDELEQALPLWAIMATISIEAPADADAVLRDGEETARRHGSRLAQAFVAYVRAEWALVFGSAAIAEAAAREAVEHFDEFGSDVMSIAGRGTLLSALALLGQVDQAEPVLERLPGDQELGAFFAGQFAWTARAELRLAQGRPADALADLRLVESRNADYGWRRFPRSFARPNLARALVAVGEVEEGRSVAEAEAADAARRGVSAAEAEALMALGQALDGPAALEALSAAATAAARSASPRVRAGSRVELGSALRRAGKRQDAREHLREGGELAGKVGAKALQARALDELVIAGGKPRSTFATGVDSLTPSERRVADHAVRGLTNREIAETLFVTRKTVELHLGRTYAKLEIRSRAQLAGALGGATLAA